LKKFEKPVKQGFQKNQKTKIRGEIWVGGSHTSI